MSEVRTVTAQQYVNEGLQARVDSGAVVVKIFNYDRILTAKQWLTITRVELIDEEADFYQVTGEDRKWGVYHDCKFTVTPVTPLPSAAGELQRQWEDFQTEDNLKVSYESYLETCEVRGQKPLTKYKWLMGVVTGTANQIIALQAENARLRAAVEAAGKREAGLADEVVTLKKQVKKLKRTADLDDGFIDFLTTKDDE